MHISCRVSHVTVLLCAAGIAYAQMDPGPRGGAPGAGSYYYSLNVNEQLFFTQAQLRFQEIDSVSGTVPGETGSGLGPTFNGNSCAMCHAEPTVGGTSPGLRSPQNPVPNPQIALAILFRPSSLRAGRCVRHASSRSRHQTTPRWTEAFMACTPSKAEATPW